MKKIRMFKITISDTFCSYEYPLRIDGHNSIDMIADKIFAVYEIEKSKGTLVKDDNSKHELTRELKGIIKKYKKLWKQ